MTLRISDRIKKKLKEKHGVEIAEVEECFLNRALPFVLERRPQHQTEPPTQWFVAETDAGRKLLVSFIFRSDTREYEIKTTYPPNPQEESIYGKLCRR